MQQTTSETAHRGTSRGPRRTCRIFSRPSRGTQKNSTRPPRSAARHTPSSWQGPASARQTLFGKSVRALEEDHAASARRLTGVSRAVRKFQKKDCSVAKLVGNGHSPGTGTGFGLKANRELSVRQTLQGRGTGLLSQKVPDRDCRRHTTAPHRLDRKRYNTIQVPSREPFCLLSLRSSVAGQLEEDRCRRVSHRPEKARHRGHAGNHAAFGEAALQGGTEAEIRGRYGQAYRPDLLLEVSCLVLSRYHEKYR